MIHFRNNMTLRMLLVPIGLLSLRGYTAGSARLMGKFDQFGSITVGKKADLVVLSQNLYKVDVDDITKTDVLLTMMDGRITYVEPSVLAGPLQRILGSGLAIKYFGVHYSTMSRAVKHVGSQNA